MTACLSTAIVNLRTDARCRFISRVVIVDAQRDRRYCFACDAWLACDIGDGVVHRRFDVTPVQELHNGQYLFFLYTKRCADDLTYM